MEILWWLAPAAGATALAMLWAAWAGRPRREDHDRSEEAYARFAAAMAKEHPAAGTPPADPGPRPQHRHRRTPVPARRLSPAATGRTPLGHGPTSV